MALQVEGYSAFGAPRRIRSEPKDHVRENVRRMRQIQRASRHRETEKQAPVKALWKSTKYENVPSKLREGLEKEPDAPRPQSSNYLRAHSKTGFIPTSERCTSVEPPDDKLTVPRADSAREINMKRRDNVNYIKINGTAAKQAGMRRSPSLTALDDIKKKQQDEFANYNKGEVPKYLQNRKSQWEKAEEDRIASIPDPDLPSGHRLMPQRERLDTLEKLKSTEKELLSQVNCMPIRTDTPRIRARKEELDNKLAEIDEAVKIFSRSKVFVRLDS